MEVVGGRKNGAREGHIPEKKGPLSSRVFLARSALSGDYFQAPTTHAKDKAIIGKNSVLKISVYIKEKNPSYVWLNIGEAPVGRAH